MRICIVGSCGKKKRTSHPNAPTCEDISGKDDLFYWQEQLKGYCHPARDMYTGNQNRELVKGLDMLRSIEGIHADLFIISAGFGFLAEDELVPPYECTFSGMGSSALMERSERLGISKDFESNCIGMYDFIYLALGKNYYLALGRDWMKTESATIVQFVQKDSPENHVYLPSDNKTVQSFSRAGHKVHGAAGFKGDLLRILAEQALKKSDPYGEIVGWTAPSYLKQVFLTLTDFGQTVL